MTVTHASRTAVNRARLFVRLASECRTDQRVEFEAFVEAGIVFARAALHRVQAKHRGHPKWQAWWSSLENNPSVNFFRMQRDWLLKEAPPRVGQRVFLASIGSGGPSNPPSKADEFYFFEPDAKSATETLDRHLQEVNRLLNDAEETFV